VLFFDFEEDSNCSCVSDSDHRKKLSKRFVHLIRNNMIREIVFVFALCAMVSLFSCQSGVQLPENVIERSEVMTLTPDGEIVFVTQTGWEEQDSISVIGAVNWGLLPVGREFRKETMWFKPTSAGDTRVWVGGTPGGNAGVQFTLPGTVSRDELHRVRFILGNGTVESAEVQILFEGEWVDGIQAKQ